MQEFMEYLPFLIPIIIIQLILQIVALIHIIKHPKYRLGNRTFWILVVLFGQIIGPVIYFVLGKEE